MRYARINGRPVEAPKGAIAWKYADPTEDARWIYGESDRREIEREDPSLIEDVIGCTRSYRCTNPQCTEPSDDLIGGGFHSPDADLRCRHCGHAAELVEVE